LSTIILLISYNNRIRIVTTTTVDARAMLQNIYVPASPAPSPITANASPHSSRTINIMAVAVKLIVVSGYKHNTLASNNISVTLAAVSCVA
jgi:hypothetical protein